MIDLHWFLRNLLSYSLQLGILIGVAAVLQKLLPLRLPRLSYAYWRILLLVCLLLPLVEPWPVPSRYLEAIAPVGVIQDLTTSQLQGETPEKAGWQFPYVPVLSGLLAAGVAVRFTRLLIGAVSLRRGLKRARPVVLPWNLKQLAPDISLQPQICCADGVNGPATYGFFRPVILLPSRFPALSETQQLGVICHELRHVQRRDWLFQLAEETIRSLFWFHPLVLWLTKRIELSREQSVDQEVVQMLGHSRDYLDSLVEMASARMSGPVAALFLSESQLGQRVRLIKEGFTMSIRRLSISLTVSFVVLVAAGSLAVWSFPLQGREQDQPRPAGVPGGSVESQKRGPEPDGQSAAHREPIKVGGNVQRTKLTHWVPPEYPPDAEKAGVKGVVLARVSITEEGNVSNVESVRGHPMLTEAAVAAIQQWKYSPTLLNGRAVPVIATQAVSFPPGKEPDKLPSAQPLPFDPERVVQLRLDETGALFSGRERLDDANLSQALQGKDAMVFAVPQNEPSIEIIEKTIKMLEQGGVRVQFYSPSYRYIDGRMTPSQDMILPVRGLAETGKALGYARYRWTFNEDGRRTTLQDGQIPEASEGAIAAARGRLDSWDVTATYKLTLDAQGNITDVRRIGGSAVPAQLDEFAAGLVGKVYRGRTSASTVELEISFK